MMKPLSGLSARLSGCGYASDYAGLLLASLGARVHRSGGTADEHPALSWCRSGLMALTGRHAGPARMCPLPIAACADGVQAALTAIQRGSRAEAGAYSRLLGMRAGIAGLKRNGAISPGGSCRLLPALDGMIAINLARDDDWTLVPAWLETEKPANWRTVANAVALKQARSLTERARLLGLAAAISQLPPPGSAPWYHQHAAHPGTIERPPARPPLVIDLSSLWAGPLCGRLLRQSGAAVIKVESSQRPDGARRGPKRFFDLLNAGKASVQLDFSTASGIDALRCLIEHADIVIESSRPRALQQLGIDARAMVESRPGLTWISITGHGRAPPCAEWIAFGDDAGVAAGLSGLMKALTGEDLICGDAIGDPLTGLHAALLAWSGFLSGGSHLLALSLHGVLAHCMRFALPASMDALRLRQDRWQRHAAAHGAAEPGLPQSDASGAARPLGADTTAVLSRWGIPC